MENGITSASATPHLIDWAITGRCNLHCQHCRGMREGELTIGQALQLVDEIVGLKPSWLIIEGGEPLLRKNLFTIIEKLRQSQISLHLITNGMLLTNEILSVFDNLSVKLMISMDGANSDSNELDT